MFRDIYFRENKNKTSGKSREFLLVNKTKHNKLTDTRRKLDTK